MLIFFLLVSLKDISTNTSPFPPPQILPDRKQFKHVVFGPLPWPPSSHPNNDPPYFPAVRDAILAKNWTAARIAADQVATVLQAAADGLSK